MNIHPAASGARGENMFTPSAMTRARTDTMLGSISWVAITELSAAAASHAVCWRRDSGRSWLTSELFRNAFVDLMLAMVSNSARASAACPPADTRTAAAPQAQGASGREDMKSLLHACA